MTKRTIIEEMLREAVNTKRIIDSDKLVEYILSGGELDERLLSNALPTTSLLYKIIEKHGMITGGFPSTNAARMLAMSEARHYESTRDSSPSRTYETLRLFPDCAKEVLLERLVSMELQADSVLVRLFYYQLDARICELMLPIDSDTLRLLMSKIDYSDRTFLHWMTGMEEPDDDVLSLIPKHLFHEAFKRLFNRATDKKCLCECALRSINITPETHVMILGKLARYKNISTVRIKVPLDLAGLTGKKLCRVLKHAGWNIVPRHRITGLPITEEEFRAKTLETALTDKDCYETALDSFKSLITGKNDFIPDTDRLYSLVERIDSSNPTQTLMGRARDLNDEKVWEAIPALVQVSEDVRFNRIDQYSGKYESSTLMPAEYMIEVLNKMGLRLIPE